MTVIDRDPWERLKGETSKAYAAFSSYRDTPPISRSIAKCCKAALGDEHSSTRQRVWERWSSKNKWVDRSEAWDYEIDRVARQADLDGIAEMRKNHIKLARGLQDAGAKGLVKLIKRLENGKKDISDGFILQYVTQGAVMERTARGEPDTIVQEVGKDGVLELIWEGPPIADQDAPAPSGPVDSEAEPGEI